MKTIEFKLSLTRSQEEILNQWMSALKFVWNLGVALIKEFNSFNHYDKRFKQSAPCCPIVAYNHKLRVTNGATQEGWRECEFPIQPIGFQLLAFDEENPIDVGKRTPCGVYPVIVNGHAVKNLTYFGIQGAFAHKRNQDKPWLTCIPSKFVHGTVQSLADSWQAFLSGNSKRPKFKGKNDQIKTLVTNNAKDITTIKGDRIRIPNLGYVRAKGLSKRWHEGVPICSLKICKKASGYYLQLTGDIEACSPKKTKIPKVQAVGLDPGIEHVYCDDAGRKVKVPQYLERDLQKLKQLQRKAQKQWDMNKDTVDQNGEPWQKKNWRRTQDKIAKLHERIARRGRAFNHFQSTKLVRQFQQIYLEDYKPSEVIKKVAPVDSGKMVVNKNDELTTIYEKNERFLNRSTNRAAQRNRVGQLWTMIKTKGGKKVVLVEAAGTSDECPSCGHVEEKTLRQRLHRCKNCGFVAHRDVAAAKIIKKRGMAQSPQMDVSLR